MKEIIEKLIRVKDLIVSEKKGGNFNFFSLFERTNLVGKWDLIISAKWLNGNNNEKDLIYIIEKIKAEFDGNLDFLGKILLISPTELLIKEIANSINKEKITSSEVFDLKLGDTIIKHIYIIDMNFNGIDITIPQPIITTEEVKNF